MYTVAQIILKEYLLRKITTMRICTFSSYKRSVRVGEGPFTTRHCYPTYTLGTPENTQHNLTLKIRETNCIYNKIGGKNIRLTEPT